MGEQKITDKDIDPLGKNCQDLVALKFDLITFPGDRSRLLGESPVNHCC
jgi:hypothetical protein